MYKRGTSVVARILIVITITTNIFGFHTANIYGQEGEKYVEVTEKNIADRSVSDCQLDVLDIVTDQSSEDTQTSDLSIEQSDADTILSVSGNVCDSERNYNWEIDLSTGEMSIKGTGPLIKYYDQSVVPYKDYRSKVKKVTIEDGITAIGQNAFYGFENLEEIILPDEIKTVGAWAFGNCKKLKEISLPHIQEIGGSAFKNCTMLEKIVIGRWLSYIRDNAFYNCKNLEKIYLSERIRKIERDAFTGSALKTVEYGGPKIRWNYVIKEDKNDELLNANIKYRIWIDGQINYNPWYYTMAEGFANGDGSLSNPYQLTTKEELALTAYLVSNDVGEFNSKSYVLENDIYINDISDWTTWNDEITPANLWISIGSGNYKFKGNFNGNNHTVYGLYETCKYQVSEDLSLGLFGEVENATIQNVNVEACYISGRNNIGGLVGKMLSGNISNCYVHGILASTGTFCGGLIGNFTTDINKSEINQCVFDGEVHGFNYVGGIFGNAETQAGLYSYQKTTNYDLDIIECVNNGVIFAENENCGGIAGGVGSHCHQLAVYSCTNNGEVIAKGNKVAGIIGYGGTNEHGNSNAGYNILVDGCKNTANIVGAKSVAGILGYTAPRWSSSVYISKSSNVGNVRGTSYVGGILGQTTAATTIENCYNTGTIEGTGYVGGIHGAFLAEQYYPTSNKTVINSYNVGSIIAEKNKGGIGGYSADKSFYYGTYYLDACIENNGNKQGTPLTEQQMKSIISYQEFDFNNIWDINQRENNGYPYLITVPNLTSDNEIIAEVKKYADNTDYLVFESIMKSDQSEEIKFKKLNALFTLRGITDPQEGIKYLSEMETYRRKYLYLTTNEIYCAYNWSYWLNCTTKGNLARGLLYADGLIFNYELNSYLDWKTYVNSKYPGVEKCKTMLKKFMQPIEDENIVSEVASNSKKLIKNMKNAIKINDLTQDAICEEIMDRVINAKNQKELEKWQNEFAKWMMNKAKVHQEITINGKTELYLGTEGLSKCLNYASPIISFSASTAQDIVDIMNLEKDIQNYLEYDNFLVNIYTNNDISTDMRVAAYQLHDEIKNGYFNKTKSILSNFISMGLDFMYLDKGMLETYLESHSISTTGAGLLGDAMATITLATVISNIVIDAGDFVKQAAYTQGYAELSVLYTMKLQEDKAAFLKNQNAENAWKFYEDYNLLWRLRYKGEEQYLKMNEIKVFLNGKYKTNNYTLKSAVVKDNLKTLGENKFVLDESITHPESLNYIKKMVIECPVDVTIKTKDGKLVAELKDGILSDTTNSYGRFVVVYDSYKEDYTKVIYLSTTDEMDIKISACENGFVSCYSASENSDVITSFSNIYLDYGDTIDFNETSYCIQSKNGAITIKNYDADNDSNYIKPAELKIIEAQVNIKEGESKAIDFSISPNNTTNKNTIWYSEDDSIATVKNGVIYGNKSGNTKIGVIACDNPELEKIITVHIDSVGKPSDNSISSPTPVPSASPRPNKNDGNNETIVTPQNGEQLIDNRNTKAVYKVTNADIKNPEVSYVRSTDKNASIQRVPNEVVINNVNYKVTKISDRAYLNNKKIRKLIIGSNITTIGKEAFRGCSKLKSITIGKNVTIIEDKAFYKCTALTKITIPANVTKICKSVFEGCKKLKTVTIKSTKIKGIGSKAFKGINANAKIKVPKAKYKIYKRMLILKGISRKHQKIIKY